MRGPTGAYLMVMIPTPILAVICLAASAAPPFPSPALWSPAPWGEDGHRLIGAAAAAALPPEMPEFFRTAGAQLSYLNYEPDRWRNRELGAMDVAFSNDHFIDMERVPAGAMDAPDRYAFLTRLYRETRLQNPARDAGLLPFRTIELYQRLLTQWRLWRAASPEEKPFIEQRILNDAGILGHYVADGSNPMHTTIHYDGWDANTPNPNRYPTARGLHAKFESAYVRAHVTQSGMRVPIRTDPARLDDVPVAIRAHLMRSFGKIDELYRIERDFGFDAERAAGPEAFAFVVERLGAGATMLRDLWYTAWVKSAETPPR
jgi:hypothetical protein